MALTDEKRKQVADQCKVVAHLARALADVTEDYAKILGDGTGAMDSLLDQVGDRTSHQMEVLGNILNGMDAVSEDDDWVGPIFAKAHEIFPQPARSEG